MRGGPAGVVGHTQTFIHTFIDRRYNVGNSGLQRDSRFIRHRNYEDRNAGCTYL
jgi:hypothetical protein